MKPPLKMKKRQKSRLLSNEFSGIFRDGSFCSQKETAHKAHKAECSKFQLVCYFRFLLSFCLTQ